jgi:hypothetical protein
VPQDALARQHHCEGEAADEVHDERDPPELAELQERSATAVEPGDRDEEVLGEELGAADDDEDERDPEADCARQVRETLAPFGSTAAAVSP